MLRRLLLIVVLTAPVVVAQSSAPAQSAPDAPSAQQPTARTSADSQQDDSEQAKKRSKNPIKRLKEQVAAPWCVHVGGSAEKCLNDKPQSKPGPEQRASTQNSSDRQDAPPPNQATPRSDDQNRSLTEDGESSSRQTIIDLRPPKNDAVDHPESGSSDVSDDVQEVHKWDPHKAAKDVEVGDYYFKRENYLAAESRYLEALDWKDNYAEAMYKLGLTEEKLGNDAAAQKYFSLYLKTLPEGEYAAEAQASLARLAGSANAKQKTTASQK